VRPTDKLTLSLATFYNDYDELRSLNGTPPAVLVIANDFEGETYGVELSGKWQATAWWRLRGGYTYLHKDLRATTPVANPSVREGNDPQQQFLLQSILDLPAHFQFDVVGRYVDTLGNPNVPGYFTCDVRLAWQYKDCLEISVVGQNLWDNQHPEFGAAASRQEIPRSIYGKVTWRF
jgi:iron complex outermembrane receptor protein